MSSTRTLKESQINEPSVEYLTAKAGGLELELKLESYKRGRETIKRFSFHKDGQEIDHAFESFGAYNWLRGYSRGRSI